MKAKKELIRIKKINGFADEGVVQGTVSIKFMAVLTEQGETILIYPSHLQASIEGKFFPTSFLKAYEEIEQGKVIEVELPVVSLNGVKMSYEALLSHALNEHHQGARAPR